MKLISGTSNPNLAQKIAKELKIDLVNAKIDKFSNGEKRVWIKDELRGENVTVVQSFVQPVDETIIETLLIIDALERLGVRHVSLVIPWMGYSLQDKVFRPGEPISAKVIANLCSNAYVKRALLMDLHNDSIPAFFDIPTNYLSALEIFTQHVQHHFDLKQSVVASPDFGGLKRARTFAKKLNLDLVNIDKTRDLQNGKVRAVHLHGEVKNKNVIILDDVIVSGSTVVESAKCLKDNEAKEVVFIASHGLLTGNAKQKLQNSLIDQVWITNSIYHANLPSKIKTLNVAPVFAQALKKWV
jgi:ribose-phosphate pyrophosphokinase